MSVIQQIQEKYAKLMAVIIALALITFVVMLAFENGTRLFGGPTDTIGKVNGKKIKADEFNILRAKIETNLQRQQEQQGYSSASSAALSQQALDQTWNYEVNKILLDDAAEDLGLTVGKAEMDSMLYSTNPSEMARQLFSNQQTPYDPVAVRNQIREIRSGRAQATPEQLDEVLDQMVDARITEKYNALLTNSINYPKWMIEQENVDNSQMARVSFVREVYTSIPDSSIKVSNEEIEKYISKRKDQFKQLESRSIAYVAFSALPNGADSAATLNALLALKPEFDSTNNAADFVSNNSSLIKFDNAYYSRAQLAAGNQQMQMGYKDSVFNLPVNAVYGPYQDGNSYALAKKLDNKILPDSVECRHILLPIANPQNPQGGGFTDSVAKFKADSIQAAIARGASFDSLEAVYGSPNDGAHQNKGVMTFAASDITSDNFAKEFAQFILYDGKVGDKKVVKTSFGWHYIEILRQANPSPHFKIAYLAKAIEASPETINEANNEAAKFASSSTNMKSFDASAEKLKREKGINKNLATNIVPMASEIQGLGSSRQFVRDIYAADVGDVLEPTLINDTYVVAIVTAAPKEGTMSANEARAMVEPLLRNHKKAEAIIKKIGKVSTLEDAAAKLGKTIEVADSVRIEGQNPLLGFEPRVIGASFNKANLNKVSAEAIEGNQGVYVIRVENVSATTIDNANVAATRQQRYQQAKMQMMYQGSPLQVLQQAATIKDYRAELY